MRSCHCHYTSHPSNHFLEKKYPRWFEYKFYIIRGAGGGGTEQGNINFYIIRGAGDGGTEQGNINFI